jgi:hypothetical protein
VEELKRPVMSILDGRDEPRDQVVQAHNRTGREIICRVTYSPLFSKDKTIEGAIIMIEDEVAATVE